MILEYLKKRFTFRNVIRQQQRSKPVLRTRPRVEQFEDRTVPSVLDLTGVATSGFLNAGQFVLMNQQPAGSGVIDPFVRLHATGCCDTTPEGHNTSGRNAGSPKLNFDENTSPVFTHNLLLRDVPIVSATGPDGRPTRYREFRLDFNEPNHNPAVPVSLNKVKIFTASTGNRIATPNNLATLGTLRWDMDGNTASASVLAGSDLDSAAPSANGNWVKMNDRNHGSGQADMRLLVPDSAFGNAQGTDFVYFYSRFGDTLAMSGGFEEWYVGPARNLEAANVVTRIDRELSGGGEQQGPIGSVFNVPLGSTVHDHAFVTPADGTGTPTGTVTYSFFTTIDCSGDTVDVTVPLGSQSSSQGPLHAGAYAYAARYNGDSNFSPGTAVCEPLQVDKGTLTLTTTMHDASHAVVANGAHVPLGTVMHDNATLGGTMPFTPTGAITFTFSGGALGANAATEAGFYATSANTTALAAQVGAYSFSVSYAGNSDYNAIASGSHNPETFIVDKGTLTLTTVMHQAPHGVVANGGHVALGTVMHDNATFTAGVVTGFAPTGAVSFTLNGGAVATLLAAEAGFYATSADSGPLASNNQALNTYNASFAGDANYNAIALGSHNPETFVVDKGTLTLTTVMHQAAHGVVADGGHVALGTVMHDNALLSGAHLSFAPTGAVSFTLNGGAVATLLAAEAGFYATSADSGPLASNNQALNTYNASFAGDTNYNAIALGSHNPETFIVNKGTLTLTTVMHQAAHVVVADGGNVPLGTVMHDNAAFTAGVVAGFAPTGAVSFSLTGPGGTSGVANAAAEGGFYATSADSAALAAGNYAYNASYAGDSNYNAIASGAHNPETFVVDRKQLAIRTDIHNASHQVVTVVPFHSNVHDTATVTGAVAGFAIPSISFFLNGNPVATDPSADPPATARSVDSGPLQNGSYTYYATVGSNSNYIGAQSADEPLTVNPNLNRTQGYWKTHAGFGSQENAWPVDSISIGGVIYSKAEAVAIMELSTDGNAISSLFQQLVAFKLNVLSGFSAATAAEQAAADGADAAIATATGGNKLLIVAPNTLNYIVHPSSVLGQEMVGYITILTAFNQSSGL